MAYYLFNFTKAAAEKGVPLTDQASALLRLGLWGIGDKTPNRGALIPGDRVLAYVGAPEQLFVGYAIVGSEVHDWTPDEASRYPGSWKGGVSFSDSVKFDPPVSLKAIWSEMPAAKTNPGANFFAGVMRIKEQDFRRVLEEAGADLIGNDVRPAAQPDSAPLEAQLFEFAESVKPILAKNPDLNEDATRANLITPLLKSLGYDGVEDIGFNVSIPPKGFADYVLNVKGDSVAVVEAKKLGASLGPQEAAQLVSYASTLAVRWGILTDGRFVGVYDLQTAGVLPEDRLLFNVDLLNYTDPEDFAVRVSPNLGLISCREMDSASGLERKAAEKAIRDLMTTLGTHSLQALRSELAKSKLVPIDEPDLAQMMGELLS